MANTKGKVARRVCVVAAVVVALLVCAGAWYVNDYYHADQTALNAAADADGSADGVTVRELAGGALAFVPDAPKAGLVFYPGGKVQPESYAPLLTGLARRGFCCVLKKPLFNLAILDGGADGIREQFPQVDTWLLAGHSLGGVVASGYLAQHKGDFAGIVFLAAYSTEDLTAYEGHVLSLAGTNDGVLKRDAYEAASAKLPAGFVRADIEGGNHAQFGNYGAQAGDGQATITADEQQAQTVDAITGLIDKLDR